MQKKKINYSESALENRRTYNRNYNPSYYLDNKERLNKKTKEYYQINKKSILDRMKVYQSEKFENKLLNSARSNARNKQLPFDLELSDIVIPEQCVYLNVPLTRILGEGIIETNASIDKIEPSKGYVKGNIQIISWMANKMKQNATVDELILFAKNVLKVHNVD